MHDTSKYTRILSIDGGGLRGIIPGLVLVELERKLRRAAGPEARIADFFDLIAGTSTGGILACGLLCPDPDEPDRPRYTAREVVDLYVEHGPHIFDRSAWQVVRSLNGWADEKYAADNLEGRLEAYFGDTWLYDLVKPCIVTAYDIEARKARFFASHDVDSKKNHRVRDVARATSAAPTFFEAARIADQDGERSALVDGGVFANNPAMCAYAEARTLTSAHMPHDRPTASRMLLLSLGTGKAERSYEYDDAKDWGPLGWARPVLDIMMTGVAETVHYQLEQIFDAAQNADNYTRIDPRLDRALGLDDADDASIDALELLGRRVAAESGATLDAVVGGLTATGSRSSDGGTAERQVATE